MKVIYVDNMPAGGVACVNRETGEILVNAPRFARLTHFEQRFVLLHEEGHYVLNTNNEYDADAYAFDRLVGTEPGSLLKLAEVLENALPFTTAEHKRRVWVQLQRALRWDAEHGNPRAAAALQRMTSNADGSGNDLKQSADDISTSIANDNRTFSQRMADLMDVFKNFSQMDTGAQLALVAAAVTVLVALMFVFNRLTKPLAAY